MQSGQPPFPPFPQQVVRNRWGWVIGAVAFAVIASVLGGFLYVSARGDVDEANARLESVRSDLASTNDELAGTQKKLTHTRKELKSSEGVRRIVINCSFRLLASWYRTLNDSYEVTGLVLQRAVNSAACDIPRRAYQRTQ